jgi:hypothetical protein
MQPQQNDQILDRTGRKSFKKLYAQIGLLLDQLVASAAREAQALRELAGTKCELAASNRRADSLARSSAEVARLQEHVAALSAHIQEHLRTLGNLPLSRFAEAQAIFTGQMPLVTANLVVAVDRMRNSGPPQPAQRIGCWGRTSSTRRARRLDRTGRRRPETMIGMGMRFVRIMSSLDR